MKEKWDERYRDTAFAYGEEPNNYLKEKLSALPTGTILFPAEGEGRNAVYAASLGWTTYAFDQSEEGKKKAMLLAEKKHTSIQYDIGNPLSLNYQPNQFDAMALIYAHFPAETKSTYHRHLHTYLKPGGLVIFEAFSKKHLEYVTKHPGVGGPKDIDMLFSIDEIKSDFENFDLIELNEVEITLNEGVYHNGTGSVIRFMGRKK